MNKPLFTYVMDDHDHQKTLSDFFSTFHISRKFINHLFNLKRIVINHKCAKINDIIHKNDCLSIDFSDEIPAFPNISTRSDISIIYEDDHLVIIDKPIGLVIYDNNVSDTLTGRVQAYYQKLNYSFPVLPAHRIDVETSGLVIYAKHPLALSYISYLFETKAIKKVYRAMVDCTNIDNRMIDMPIKEAPHTKTMIIDPKGLDAKTIIKLIDKRATFQKIELNIIGGRKHQIRVHLKSINCPIVGDRLYGGSPYARMLLHAKEVTFIHPFTQKEVTYKTDEPF